MVDNVDTVDFKDVTKYDEVVNLGEDTVAPTIKSVEKINASQTKVTFSEPVNAVGNFTFKLADGTLLTTGTDVVVSSLSADKQSVTLTVSNSDYAGKVVTATLLGTTDFSGNLVNPNPTTFNFQVGQKDGITPTVASVTAVSPTQVEVEFSEEVSNVIAESVTINNTPATAVTQDSTNKKKYVFTVANPLGGADSALVDFKLSASTVVSGGTGTVADGTYKITDLSGEEMAKDSTQILSVKKDTAAPTLVSSSVVAEGSNKYLVLNFNENLSTATSGTPALPTAVTAVASTASSYKDYITVSGKSFTFGTATGDVALTADGKGIKINLASAKFDGADLVDGAKYSFDVTGTDTAGLTSTPAKVEFTYAATASADKPKVTNATSLTGQSTVTLTFDRELDGASATNVNNYQISGVTVKNATLAPASGGTQDVVLTLDSNSLSGARAIEVSGVKSKAGVAMDKLTGTVTLTENVKPELVSAAIKGTKVVELTFSEAIDLTTIAEDDDFEVKIGSKTLTQVATADLDATGEYAVAAPSGVTGSSNKLIITLNDALSETDLASTLSVKALSAGSSVLADNAGNTIVINTVTAK